MKVETQFARRKFNEENSKKAIRDFLAEPDTREQMKVNSPMTYLKLTAMNFANDSRFRYTFENGSLVISYNPFVYADIVPEGTLNFTETLKVSEKGGRFYLGYAGKSDVALDTFMKRRDIVEESPVLDDLKRKFRILLNRGANGAGGDGPIRSLGVNPYAGDVHYLSTNNPELKETEDAVKGLLRILKDKSPFDF